MLARLATSLDTSTHTSAPLLRYLQAEPVARDHEGRIFSATDYVLTQPTCVPDQHPDDYPDNTTHAPANPVSPTSPVSLVLNLLMAPREQRLSTPPPVPIDHPGVVVIVDHSNGTGTDSNKRSTNHRVIERGSATVQAVRKFLENQLYLPTMYLPAEMIREPYFDCEQFDAVSYSEIVAAMSNSDGPWDTAPWHIHHLLQLAVYEVEAGRLITPEEVAQLPYC